MISKYFLYILNTYINITTVYKTKSKIKIYNFFLDIFIFSLFISKTFIKVTHKSHKIS